MWTRVVTGVCLCLMLAGCASLPGGASEGVTPTADDAPRLFAIDRLVHATANEGIDLHVRYAERRGDMLRLVLALYNNGSEDVLAVPGISLDGVRLMGAVPAELVERSASFERSLIPQDGWFMGGASNGSLTFAPATGTTFTLDVPGFPPVSFRLDVPLRVAPEPVPPADGTYPLGFVATSSDLPGMRLLFQRVEVAADELAIAIRQEVDLSVARTSGIDVDGIVLFDARWNQYRPQAVEGIADTAAMGDEQTGATPFVLRFARPAAGDYVLIRIPNVPLIRLPLRADDEPAWAGVQDLPPAYKPRAIRMTPDQPMERSDDPATAVEQLLTTLNTALETRDLQRYLDAFTPSARPAQQAVFERLQTLPLEDVALVPDAGAQTTTAAPTVHPVLWRYRVRDVDARNEFAASVELVLERDGEAWRIGELRGTLPFWASGPTEVQRSGTFWILFRPDDREALATIEQDVNVALERVSKALPAYANGPFVMFVTSTPDEFARQTGRDPQRFVGAALSRWVARDGVLSITGAAFYLNGAVLRADPSLDRERTVTHELTHLVLSQQTMPFTPLWLVEGMAMHVADELPVASMQAIMASGDLDRWRLEEFSAVPRFGEHDPQGQQTAVEYAYSAYLVRYLIDTYGWERFVQFYVSFAQVDSATIRDDLAEASGPDLIDPVMSRLALRLLPAALQSSFGVDPAALEQSFKAWVPTQLAPSP